MTRKAVAKGKMAKVRRALCRRAMHFKQGNVPMTSVALRMNVNIVVAKTIAGRPAPTLPTRDLLAPGGLFGGEVMSEGSGGVPS